MALPASLPTPISITDYRAEFGAPLVALWRDSFAQGVGVAVPNSVEAHRHYFETQVLPHDRVDVAFEHGILVGFIAATPESVTQLYVHVAHLGKGIGTRLLDLAKSRSGGSLWLYTFACNARARRFYEHHGFEFAERGFEPVMQLEDVTYRWKRDAGTAE